MPPAIPPEALEILKAKRKGGYNVVQIDPDYRPAPVEQKDVFGVTFEQGRNEFEHRRGSAGECRNRKTRTLTRETPSAT